MKYKMFAFILVIFFWHGAREDFTVLLETVLFLFLFLMNIPKFIFLTKMFRKILLDLNLSNAHIRYYAF